MKKTEVFGRMLVFQRVIWTGLSAWRGSEHHWEVIERQRWCKGGQMPLAQPEIQVKTAVFPSPGVHLGARIGLGPEGQRRQLVWHHPGVKKIEVFVRMLVF